MTNSFSRGDHQGGSPYTMHNPLIALFKWCSKSTDACASHYVGLTWNGKLVFFGHESASEVRALRAICRLQGLQESKMPGCCHILSVVESQSLKRTRRGRRGLRMSPPVERRLAGRITASQSGLNSARRHALALATLARSQPCEARLQQTDLSLWEILRRR